MTGSEIFWSRIHSTFLVVNGGLDLALTRDANVLRCRPGIILWKPHRTDVKLSKEWIRPEAAQCLKDALRYCFGRSAQRRSAVHFVVSAATETSYGLPRMHKSFILGFNLIMNHYEGGGSVGHSRQGAEGCR